MTEMRDELLEQVVDELRTLPPVDEAAVGRIVAAAGAETIAAVSGGRAAGRARSWWRSQVPLAAAAGLALAAGLGGFVARDLTRPGLTPAVSAPVAVTPTESLTSLVSTSLSEPVAASVRSPAAVPTQFVLDAPRARRVALVGDFNGWDADAMLLARDPSSGIWTATVPLAPGRHVYAFIVDGTALTLDPRAPKAEDPDFGTPSSVVLVGTP